MRFAQYFIGKKEIYYNFIQLFFDFSTMTPDTFAGTDIFWAKALFVTLGKVNCRGGGGPPQLTFFFWEGWRGFKSDGVDNPVQIRVPLQRRTSIFSFRLFGKSATE